MNFTPKEMFVTKKEQPNKFRHFVECLTMNGSVANQFDNMSVWQLLSLTIYPFGNLKVRQYVSSTTWISTFYRSTSLQSVTWNSTSHHCTDNIGYM
jgi:hypothetical protein